MGLSALRDFLDPQPVRLSRISGSVVAVDANNLLWTFVTGMARGGAPTGPHGRPISHLIGLTNRVRLYAELGLEAVWVFDGEPPALKAEEIAQREARRQAAIERGDQVQGTRLEATQIEEAQRLLDHLGVPWHQAPQEADAQLAHWAVQGHVDAAITQDYDIALHGCPLTFRNVKRTGRRSPEALRLPPVLEREGLSQEQLVDAAILIGTDYNDGIHGVGPVSALKLVREHSGLEAAFRAQGADPGRALAVRELFLEHPVDPGAPPTVDPPDRSSARAFLAEHGILQDRADAVVDALVDRAPRA